MTKRGARPSKSEHTRERSSHAPVSSPNLAPVPRSVRPSEPPSLAEEASLLGRDEQEAQLLTEFFSWPPPAAAEFIPPKFQRPPLSREARRAMWASVVMLLGAMAAIGGFAAYHVFVMPQPVELGQWSDSDALLLPTAPVGESTPSDQGAPPLRFSASLQAPSAPPTEAEHGAAGAEQKAPTAGAEAQPGAAAPSTPSATTETQPATTAPSAPSAVEARPAQAQAAAAVEAPPAQARPAAAPAKDAPSATP